MTSNTYPKTVTIHGSGGDAEYCAVTGEAVTDPYTNEDFLLAKIDLKEYLEYWLHLDPDGISLEIDVLDIAGWNGLGGYVEAEIDYRAEALLNRMELPGESWSGWCFVGGVLYTPENYPITGHDGTWWSLLVRQAAMFGELMAVRGAEGRTAAGMAAPHAATRERVSRRNGCGIGVSL